MRISKPLTATALLLSTLGFAIGGMTRVEAQYLSQKAIEQRRVNIEQEKVRLAEKVMAVEQQEAAVAEKKSERTEVEASIIFRAD